MNKYELKLKLYQIIEADSDEEAEFEADYEVDRLLGTGLAGDLGYTKARWSVHRVLTQGGE